MENKSPQSNKPTTPSQKKRSRNVWRGIWIVFQVLLVLGVMAVCFAGATAAGFFAVHVKDEKIRSYEEVYQEIYSFNKTGEAYFKNNEFIGYLRSPDVSQPTTVNEASVHLIDAILATEDNEFYTHEGINIKGLSRAVYEQLTTPGQGTGGSTITQQLVKQQILSSERKWDRKFREMLLAMRVERMLNKDQILEAYMNIIYLGFNANGSNIYGMRAAAEGIFNVPVDQLNIAQSAYLAGMIQSPGNYTPFTRNGNINEESLARGIKRMNFVLERMKETGRITETEYRNAKNFNVKGSLAERSPAMVERYPFLTFEIERRASEILLQQRLEVEGIDPSSLSTEEYETHLNNARRQLTGGGYKVFTTIDQEVYDGLHELFMDEKLFGPRSRKNSYTYTDPETGESKELGYLEQIAATLIDNQTGAIIAMVEGRDFDEFQYNLNTTPRQPGSSIKPLLDYAPGIDLGVLQPASILDDAPIFLAQPSGGYWVPQNFSRTYYGLVTLREALTKSHNLSAIKAFMRTQEQAGKEVPFEYLKKMGITTLDQEDEAITAVAIGGMKYGLTVEENTGAFSTFANNGLFLQPYLIERIETLDGQIVYQHEVNPVQVFSEQTAFLMNDLLRSVVNQGTAGTVRRAMGSKLEIAGKTGTTNNAYDSWFVGYTPQVSLGVWLGYPKLEELTRGYATRNQNHWVQIMKKLEEIRPEYVNEELRFAQPEDIVRRTVCSKSGKLPSDLCREAGYLVDDYFNRAFIPTETDDTLIKGRMVLVDGTRYIAQEKTPDDFVEKRVFVKREPLNIPAAYEGQKGKYLPIDWDNEAPTEEDPRQENGKVPDTPTGVKVAWKGNQIELTWKGSADNDLVGYRIYRIQADGQVIKKASIPQDESKIYIDEQVRKGEVYAYQVSAVDIAGQESAPSEVAYSDTSAADDSFGTGPSTPKRLSANLTPFGIIELSWTANPEQDKVELYQIYYTNDPVNGFTLLDQSPSANYSHTLVNPTAELYYYVTAVSELGESKASSIVRLTMGAPQPQQEPTPNQPAQPTTPQEESDTPENLFEPLP